MNIALSDLKCRNLQGLNIRINTEGKAKVVAAFWGTELIPFHAALAILHQDVLEKRIGGLDPKPLHSQKGTSPKNFSSNHPCC